MEWDSLADSIVVEASPAGLWTLASEYVRGLLTIRITAQGDWYYSPSGKCGPDGDAMSLLAADNAQSTASPIGALIAKVGGSSAGWRDGTIFLAGSFCVFSIPDGVSGPLFLTINDEFTGMGNNSGTITATVASLRDTSHAAG